MKNTFLQEEETKKALSKFVLDAQILSMGKECRKFEESFAAYQGRNRAVLFNSGGSANLALLQALKNMGRLKNEDLIGFSAVTWSTNTMPIIQLGMVPVALDCSKETLNVEPEKLERCLKDQPLKALFITNALGFAGDLDVIRDICRERGIILLEDNCESLGSELKGTKLGNFGLASTFSFFVSHHMSTIEGGMICTDDLELTAMLKLVRANGWDRNLEEEEKKTIRAQYRVQSELDAKYTFYDLGYNLRPTEITGFLGQQQLIHLPASILKRQDNYVKVERAIKSNPDLLTLKRDHLTVLSNFAIPILCKTPELREKYGEKLEQAGVEIRPLIAGNIQRQPFYGKYVPTSRELKGADFIHRCGLYCGNHPDYCQEELTILEDILGGGK
ncbi:DegT/DnrJ/EryC1/StrS family aminotransferase [Dethiosulfovibrio marinus]|uniref:DegT/DnrJ/EryC1/StrS family aminotransferase n=1 Tax=Dethiosulfovibrio marinus TaxID=133532 RepID=A0ABS9EKB6_9BACT|nr:DegT/DnrJ/EryC1/StrS family aminotransferase [Dethiosulfovibrio marinus]